MSSKRQKEEDERNEQIIRKLLRIPGNGSCVNCGSLGPEYVCLNFSTFVCSFCSGVHSREFSHRVKSISMARFTKAEIDALQSGGNNNAREIYFWTSSHKLPECNNLSQIRNFLNEAYKAKPFPVDKSVCALNPNIQNPKEKEISEKVLRQLLQPPVVKSRQPTNNIRSRNSTPTSRIQRISTALPSNGPSPRPSPSVKKSSSTSLLDLMTSSPPPENNYTKNTEIGAQEPIAAQAKMDLPLVDLIDFTGEYTDLLSENLLHGQNSMNERLQFQSQVPVQEMPTPHVYFAAYTEIPILQNFEVHEHKTYEVSAYTSKSVNPFDY